MIPSDQFIVSLSPYPCQAFGRLKPDFGLKIKRKPLYEKHSGSEYGRYYDCFFLMKEGTSGVKPLRVWVRGGSETPSS